MTAIATLALGATLASCSSDSPEPTDRDAAVATETSTAGAEVSQLLRRAGLPEVADLVTAQAGPGETRAVIDGLEALGLAERPEELSASVQQRAVVLQDASGRQARMPMPEDRFYLSVAPFRDQTHPCDLHSLTGCVGELGSTEVQVRVVSEDGTVLVQEQRETAENGFVGLWLPRDVRGTVHVSSRGPEGVVRGSAPFGTGDQDPTCLTTLQLA